MGRSRVSSLETENEGGGVLGKVKVGRVAHVQSDMLLLSLLLMVLKSAL